MSKRKDEITEIKINGDKGWSVETWWDGQSANWITQLKSPSGFQIGDTNYVYRKTSAMKWHKWLVENAQKVADEELKSRSD